jgi:hypothetical protein
MFIKRTATSLEALRDKWAACWPVALGLWSKFTKLSDPRWCLTAEAARQEGLTESFAMIRLMDHAVVINLEMIRARHLDSFGLEILAHEIGHHVYCPADLTDQGRMIARMRWGLPTKEHLAGFIGNLYADLLINDRLQRSANLNEVAVYETLGQASDRLWTLYMRIFEILWSRSRGSLAAQRQMDDRLEGDAQLGARLIRVYARDWLEGAGKFAALCLPYLIENDGEAAQKVLRVWLDTQQAGTGATDVPGLTGRDGDEKGGALHPALDPTLTETDAEIEAASQPREATGPGGAAGQHREPFEYGAILKALGLNLSDHEVAVRYYKERAIPHLIRFPSQETPQAADPLPEGLEPWDIGSPLEEADWLASLQVSPQVIPGVTTVQRVWGVTEGETPKREPLDLDLYVDCSGSMPNPQNVVSYLTLAGAIVALSALRAGANVQATLWSGARQFETTGGFVRDERRILQILTGYLGGGTAFPVHLLRETYRNRGPKARPAHILVISDDGVTTMFDQDEQGNSGWEIAQMALDKARGGGTLVLNMYRSWEENEILARAYVEQNWQIATVQSWEALVEFARRFSARTYGPQSG